MERSELTTGSKRANILPGALKTFLLNTVTFVTVGHILAHLSRERKTEGSNRVLLNLEPVVLNLHP